MEVVLFSFEFCRCVDLGGADLLYRHLHIVHPLDHLAVPGVVHLPDEGVVLLPEGHLGPVLSVRGEVPVSANGALTFSSDHALSSSAWHQVTFFCKSLTEPTILREFLVVIIVK